MVSFVFWGEGRGNGWDLLYLLLATSHVSSPHRTVSVQMRTYCAAALGTVFVEKEIKILRNKIILVFIMSFHE